jgi:hypothetical protein
MTTKNATKSTKAAVLAEARKGFVPTATARHPHAETCQGCADLQRVGFPFACNAHR